MQGVGDTILGGWGDAFPPFFFLMFSVSIDKKIMQSMKMYEKGIAGLASQEIQKGIIMGANAAAGKARTRTKSVVAKAMKVPGKTINKDIKVIKAKSSGRMPVNGAQIIIKASGRRLRLIHWTQGVKVTKRKGRITGSKGIKANAWGKSKLYPGTFIAPVKYAGAGGVDQSTDGIFTRLSGSRSLPIQQLYGPGVGREAERHEAAIMQFYADEARIQIPKKLEYIMRRALAKK